MLNISIEALIFAIKVVELFPFCPVQISGLESYVYCTPTQLSVLLSYIIYALEGRHEDIAIYECNVYEYIHIL